MKKSVVCILILSLGLVLANTAASTSVEELSVTKDSSEDDFDAFSDIAVTVEIKKIRSLEMDDDRRYPTDKIDLFSDPDFYVKIKINEETFTSQIWRNKKYVYEPDFQASLNVPDDREFVNISIQLYDRNLFRRDTLCDISPRGGILPSSMDIDLLYSIKTGHWMGDDYILHENFWGSPDPSGYGRLNGCDDNSYYENNRDCELWFDIYQTDPDGDGIPTWTEEQIYETNPEIDDTGRDDDNDSVPIEWEHKWGHMMYQTYQGEVRHLWVYDPFTWENHEKFDDDEDGLSNVEEYLTSQWGSDPFRADLFIELDQMQAGPNGEPASIFPEESKEMLRTAYDKRNIVYHLDDGSWEESGSDMIPFDEETEMSWGSSDSELMKIYENYFLQGNENNWRRGVFHYGVLIYQCNVANGNAFGSNRFQISSRGLEEKARNPLLRRDVVYASAYMHETGHTLDIWNDGVDNQLSKYPWQINWWRYRPYKSVMNYGYMYLMLDYSDGSRGMNDFDDWGNLDLTFFDTMDW